MKFVKYLESIMGIEIFPMISLMLFFTFFVFLFWYVIKADKKRIEEIKNLPLNEEH